jgi:hypothetical protein
MALIYMALLSDLGTRTQLTHFLETPVPIIHESVKKITWPLLANRLLFLHWSYIFLLS